MSPLARLAAIKRRHKIVARFAPPPPDFERSGIIEDEVDGRDLQELRAGTVSRAMARRYHQR